MSTVAIEFQNAECPKCGVEALEYFDRYLRPEEVVEMCDCGVEPEYTPVHCYQAVCDRCGEHVTEYGEWCAIGPTPGDMWEYLEDWEHIGGRDLCPGCWHINNNDEIEEVAA